MSELFEKLGKKALVMPFVVAIALCCLLSVVLAPMIRAEAHNVPFAIVNLDKGAVSVTGKINVGETLTDNLLSGEASLGDMGGNSEESSDDDASSSLSGSVAFTQLESEEEALAALENNEYYGAIIIPANFTSQQVSTMTGSTNAPELTIYLNKGRNAQMASSMQVTLGQAMLSAGIAADIQMVNTADVGGGSMGETMMAQITVMPLFMMLLIGSILIAMIFWLKDALGMRRDNPLKLAGIIALLIVAYTAFAAAMALFIVSVIGNLSMPVLDIFPVLWGVACATMLCFVGVMCLCFPLGALLTICVFALGMGTAMLPAEMLPAFWADFICPWAPQAALGQTVRSVVYLGHVPGIETYISSIVFAIVGILSLVAGALLSRRRSDRDSNKTESATHAKKQAAAN